MGKVSYEAHYRYEKKVFDTVTFRVKKGQRELIKKAAAAAGLSMNQYICGALTAAGCPVSSKVAEDDKGED